MAVLDQGKVRFAGAPKSLIKRLANQVWQAEILPQQIPAFQQQFPLLSSRFIGGRCQVRVVAPTAPAPSFIQASADFQDSYFYLLQQHQPAGLDLCQPQVA